MSAHDITTLEGVLTKVAADNGLDTVAIGRMPVGDRVVWTATVHYELRGAHKCSQASSDHSIRYALSEAISLAAAARTPIAIMPLALPPLEVAA